MIRPVFVTGDPKGAVAFVAALQQTVEGWPCRVRQGEALSCHVPFSTVTAGAGLYSVESEYMDARLTDISLTSALCAVVADISEAYLDAHDGTRALHCGALQLEGRLIMLTGPGRSGKSTLMARLSMERGAEIFCDDVLPIRPDGRAVALGVPPRVRLPLPPTASAAFAVHVARSSGFADDNYAYVSGSAVAAHGQMAVPEVLLVLRRKTGAKARLHYLPKDQVVSHMLAHDMSLQSDGLGHISRVAAMADHLFCATLVYDDLEEAVALLWTQALEGALPLAPALPAGLGSNTSADLPPATPWPAAPAIADLGLVWCRRPGVGVRNAQGAAYLWDPASGQYFHLNTVGMVCWHLLEDPMTGIALSDEIAELFADLEKAAVQSDVAVLLGQLAGNGLVLSEAPEGQSRTRPGADEPGINPS